MKKIKKKLKNTITTSKRLKETIHIEKINYTICDKLKEYNLADPDEIKKPKYLISPVNIKVLDDLMGSAIAFSNQKQVYYLIIQ